MIFSIKNSYHIEPDLRNFISSENPRMNNRSINNVLSDIRHFIGWLISANSTELLRAQQSSKTDFMSRLGDSCDARVLNNYIRYLNLNKASTQTIARKLSSIKKLESFLLNNGTIHKQFTTQFIPESLDTNESVKAKGIGAMFNSSAFLTKKNILTGASLAIPIILVIIVAITNNQAHLQGGKPSIQGVNTTKDNRFITYATRITDSIGNPITSKINARFKIFPSLRSQSPLYDSNYCVAQPDLDGYVSFEIGKGNCGEALDSSMFISNPNLFLGVGINNDRETQPRKQLENVNLSYNSRQLEGLNLGSTANSIPYINKEGEMSITSDIFTLRTGENNKEIRIAANEDLNFEAGKNGDLTFKTGANGSINFQTNSAGLSSLYISDFGNIGLGTNSPSAFKLESAGSIGPTLSNAYDLGSSDRYWSNLYVRNICFFNQACVSSSFGSTSSTSLSTLDTSSDLLLGSDATSSANVKLSASSQGKSFIRSGYVGINTDSPQSALQVQGTLTTSGNSIDITTISDQDLVLKPNGTGTIQLDSAVTIDLGTTGTAFALCHSTQDGTDNEELVDCVSTPTADFAEMYPVESGTEYGDIMTLGDQIVTTTTDRSIRRLVKATTPYDNHVIGVVSNNYSDFISVGHDISSTDNPMPIALKGRVPVKISLNSEDITAGDFITTSTQPGRGMKATKAGLVIGRALENWNPSSNRDSIMVFIGNDYIGNDSMSDSLLSSIEERVQTLIANTKIVSPVIEAQTVKTEQLITSNLHLNEKDGATNDLTVFGNKDKAVATLSAQGDFSTLGNISSKTLLSNEIKTKDASISGTLIADNIQSTTIETIKNNIANAIEKSQSQDNELNSIKDKITRLKDESLSPPPWYQDLGEQTAQELGSFTNLLVTENASIFSAHIFQNIESESNRFNISSRSLISFFNDAIVLSTDGTIEAKGPIIAKSFHVKNELGNEVASIDASGSALFKRITLENQNQSYSSSSAIIAKSENLTTYGIDAPAMQTGSDTSGIGILPENEKNVVIYNQDMTAQSLFFVTPLDAVNTPLYVSEREDCKDKTACYPHITISTDSSVHTSIRFNWLIINTKTQP